MRTLAAARSPHACPSIADHRLMRACSSPATSGLSAPSFSVGGGQPLWLDGSSGPIHEVNESESLEFSDQTVLDYIRFFFYFVRGDGGFVLIESPADLDAPSRHAPRPMVADEAEVLTLDQARGSVQAPRVAEQRRYLVTLARRRDRRLSGGALRLLGIGLLGRDDRDAGRRAGRIARCDIDVPELAVLRTSGVDGRSRSDRSRGRRAPGGCASRDEQWCQPGNLLLSPLQLGDAGRETDRTVDAHHVRNQSRIVIIESDIPFVEDFVAGLAAPADAG